MHKNTWHSAWWQWKLNMSCVHDYGRWSPKMAPSTPPSPDGHAPTLDRWSRFPSPWTWAGLRLALDKRKHRSDFHRAPSGTNSGTSGSFCFCALWATSHHAGVKLMLSHQRIRPHVEGTTRRGEGSWYLPAEPNYQLNAAERGKPADIAGRRKPPSPVTWEPPGKEQNLQNKVK